MAFSPHQKIGRSLEHSQTTVKAMPSLTNISPWSLETGVAALLPRHKAHVEAANICSPVYNTLTS